MPNDIWYPVVAAAAVQGLGILVQHVRFGERLNNHIKADEVKHKEIADDSNKQWSRITDHETRLSTVQGQMKTKGASAR